MMKPQSKKTTGDRICAAIVTFNPDKQILNNVKIIARQAQKVIVVDNHSAGAAIKYLKKIENIPNVQVVYLDDNYGIGAALNIAANRAMKERYLWLATFDQDTSIENNYFQHAMEKAGAYQSFNRVGIIAPQIRDKIYSDVYSRLKTGQGMAEVNGVITSGSIVRIEAFKKTGPFDEKLFIDYVDFDFCFRMKNAGYKILMLQDLFLSHSIGDMTRNKFLGLNIYTSNHSPLRRYYKHRNRIHMLRRYFFIHPKWAIRDSLSIFFEISKILLWEKQKINKICHIIIGTIHGIAGVSGKFKSAVKRPNQAAG